MSKTKTLKETYSQCEAEGMFRKTQANKQLAKDMIGNAETYIKSANILANNLPEEDSAWMNVYINYYEALRIYTETFLSLHNTKSTNHQCLFTYLCVKFSEHTPNWDFFEKTRKKRNGAHYYGNTITHTDWEMTKKEMKKHILILKKEIEKTLR